MSPKSPSLATTPPDILLTARSRLGDKALQRVFKVGYSQIGRWIRTDEEHQRSPVETLRDFLQALVEAGEEELARNAAQYLVEPLGLRLVEGERARPDKSTVAEELLDDFAALAAIEAAVRAGRQPEVVRRLGELAKAEIDETVAKYAEERAARRP